MNREFDKNSDSQELRICSQGKGFERPGVMIPQLTRLFTKDADKRLIREAFHREIRRLAENRGVDKSDRMNDIKS